MKNENLLDQFVLVDQRVIEEMISAVKIEREDRLLEIGAGSGVLTRKLAEKSARIIAVEIDKKFAEQLRQIPGNIQLIFGDALEVLKDREKYPLKFNKITGSLPSSIVEPLMHVLMKTDFELAVFLIPLKFAFKLTADSVFTAYFERQRESSSAYFDIAILKKVSRKSFSPIPKTNWAMIKITKKPDPLKTADKERFLQQFIYEHPRAKMKNALVEGLIKFYETQGRTLTKNQARKILQTKNPP